jgi:transposase
MQNQILELQNQGRSVRAIAKILKQDRRTVARVIEKGKAEHPTGYVPPWSLEINWQAVREQYGRGVPLNILARENAADKISYVQFWRYFQKQFPTLPTVTMRLDHKPGVKSYYDWSEGIDIVNKETGEITKTDFFCGVMAMSSMTYGEFTLSQKKVELMRSMEKAFRFFGGVTPYVTVDNQKAAVVRSDWYDPDLNPGFIDFANHWGFAIIPARPMRPQDKAGNECGIGVVQRQFFQEVRNKTFFTLEELNICFREYLNRLNLAVMKDWDLTRVDRFEGEKLLLKACPENNWEPSEWKTPKVHSDCHVQVLKKFYSVPFKYVGQEVRVRITAKMIEVFDQDLNPLCAHLRLYGSELKSTENVHYPEQKVAVANFSVKQALFDAKRIGPETEILTKSLLESTHPLLHLRRVQGILRLYQSKQVSREAIEHACKMGLTFGKTRYNYIKSTAKYFDQCGMKPSLVKTAPVRESGTVYLQQTPK